MTNPAQSETAVFPPSSEMTAKAHVDAARYDEMYAASVADPEAFWAEHGKRIDWIKPFSQVKNVSFQPGEINIEWFADGTLNVAANCIDRHLESRGDQTAIIFEPEAAVGALELAVLHLVPPRFYRDAPEDPTRPSSWREEGILTREVILLSTLAIPAMEPGGARNRLLEWHADSDMRQACIWSLCLAARTDEALALELRELVLVGSLSSEAGQSLARMIEEIAGRGDLVLDLLTAELQRHETTDLEGDHVRNVVALVAMSELLASENSELASAALEQVVGIAIDPTRSEDLRFLTLAQLSALRQEQVGDAIELILVSQDESSAREWAARFATAVPPDQQPRMRDLLIETFAYGGGAGQKEALQSLTWMGGPEVDAFVASWNGSKDLSPEAQAVIDEYLAGDG